MIDITPVTDDDTEVNQGDKVRVSWLLEASVDPRYMTFTETLLSGQKTTYSGDEIIREENEIDGERYWRYYIDLTLRSYRTRFSLELNDPVNNIRDTAEIIAQL